MKFLIVLLVVFSFSNSFALDFGFSSSETTLAVANTRQPLVAVNVRASDFIIYNPVANIVSVFVGGSDVTVTGATKGIEVIPGGSLSLSISGNLGRDKLMASEDIYIVSTGTAVPVTIGRIIQ